MQPPTPLRVYEDRGFIVPSGKRVITEYVELENVILDCKERMAVGDVQTALDRFLAAGDGQPYPCPYGYWKDERFHVSDGRHAFVAALMLGLPSLLVAHLQ